LTLACYKIVSDLEERRDAVKRTLVLTVLFIFFSINEVPCVFAENKGKPEKPWKRFSINLGANFGSNNSDVRLGTKGATVSVDLEEILGLETTTTSFKVDGYWRFMPRRKHRLDFSYFSTRRTGDNVVKITDPIEINDITINPSARVKSDFKFETIQVGYSYSFFQDERLDLAVGVGAYIMPISIDL